MARNWDSLKAATRQRYERAGVSKSQYESGESLKEARGHAKTPERPERAELPRNREKYKEYIQKRQKLEREVEKKKSDMFKARPKFNARRSGENVRNNPFTRGKPPTIAYMQRFISEDFQWTEVDWEDDDWGFLAYH